jgi:hypothetical protein
MCGSSSSTRFGDAPEATLQAARDIAACSPTKNALVTAVDTAWHAVGVPIRWAPFSAPSTILGGGVVNNDASTPAYSGSWKASLLNGGKRLADSRCGRP